MNKHSFSIVGHDFHRFLIPWGGIQNEPRHKFSGLWSHWYSFVQPWGCGGVVIPLVAVSQCWIFLLWALVWNSMDSFLLCTAFLLTPISKLRLMVKQRDQRTVVVGTCRRQVCLSRCPQRMARSTEIGWLLLGALVSQRPYFLVFQEEWDSLDSVILGIVSLITDVRS